MQTCRWVQLEQMLGAEMHVCIRYRVLLRSVHGQQSPSKHMLKLDAKWKRCGSYDQSQQLVSADMQMVHQVYQ